jgi:hypothetical protein
MVFLSYVWDRVCGIERATAAVNAVVVVLRLAQR